MELFSFNSPSAVSPLPSSSWGRDAMEKPTSFFGLTLAFPSNSKRCLAASSTCYHIYRPRSSVSAQVATRSSSQTADSTKQKIGSKDKDLVFVAGATGRVGSRTVRELLKLGFRVRAGVRSAQRAEALVKSVGEMELGSVTGDLEAQPAEKLEIIECDLENKSAIASAIGNASVVICCIGASEKEVFDITGPYRIDYKAAENLIEAATVAEVEHFILVSSLGTNKIGFPAAVLNLFWGVLSWKRKAEEALISSGLPYTIVRPGGMERPTDSYKETHNIVLANEDTYFGGQVSNLQVAELMAFMAKNRRLAFCKVVEVIAETAAPLTPMEDLLSKIPSQRELPEVPEVDTVPVKEESELTTLAVEEEVETIVVPKANPLSPFAMYADLKPPTSPTPTPSTGAASFIQNIEEPVQSRLEPATSSGGTEPAKGFMQKMKPLSPYAAYEDLKPPTSPTPTPRTAYKSLDNGPASASSLPISGTGNEVIGTSSPNVNEKELPQTSSHQSPYNVYDDLKPPTSPTPSMPSVGSFIPTSAGVDTSTPEKLSAPQGAKEPRPLSPYTMYEDLKPPSSPVPSARKD